MKRILRSFLGIQGALFSNGIPQNLHDIIVKCLLGARFCVTVVFQNCLRLTLLSGDVSQKLIPFCNAPVPKCQ